MNDLIMQIKPLKCYVLKDDLTNRYLKFRFGDYTLTTKNVHEAKLFETYSSAKDEPKSKSYKIKEVVFSIDGNIDIENITLKESDVELNVW